MSASMPLSLIRREYAIRLISSQSPSRKYLRFPYENKHVLPLVRHDRPDYGVVYDANLVLSALPRAWMQICDEVRVIRVR